MNGRRLSPIARGVLIGVCFIAFFVLLENLLDRASTAKKENVVKKEEQQQQQQYEKTDRYQEEVFIEKSIEETMKLFEAQDYEALFTHIDERYGFCMGISDVESLKEFILDFYGEPNAISLLEFYRNGECLICRVRVELDDQMVVKPLVVVTGEGDDFSLMFDEVQSISDYHKSATTLNNRIWYTQKYKLETSTGYTTAFEMTNRTSTTIQGSLADSYVLTTDGRKYFVSNPDDLKSITLAPNETKLLIYKIDTSDGYYMSDLETKFILKETNGKETTLSIARPSIYD